MTNKKVVMMTKKDLEKIKKCLKEKDNRIKNLEIQEEHMVTIIRTLRKQYGEFIDWATIIIGIIHTLSITVFLGSILVDFYYIGNKVNDVGYAISIVVLCLSMFFSHMFAWDMYITKRRKKFNKKFNI